MTATAMDELFPLSFNERSVDFIHLSWTCRVAWLTSIHCYDHFFFQSSLSSFDIGSRSSFLHLFSTLNRSNEFQMSSFWAVTLCTGRCGIASSILFILCRCRSCLHDECFLLRRCDGQRHIERKLHVSSDQWFRSFYPWCPTEFFWWTIDERLFLAEELPSYHRSELFDSAEEFKISSIDRAHSGRLQHSAHAHLIKWNPASVRDCVFTNHYVISVQLYWSLTNRLTGLVRVYARVSISDDHGDIHRFARKQTSKSCARKIQ